jgi:chemotaxis protein methyltransferase CheR
MNITEEDIQLFNYVLKNNSEYDFSNYSDKSLKRRITKILMDNKMDMKMLVKKIKESSEFVENIVQRITVNTSELFRDPEVWQDIKHRILPKYKNRNLINIWHAGCSFGQEVYSMLITLNELGLFDKARVYASDLNIEALDKAKKGKYKYRFNIGYLDNFDKAIKENPMDFEEYNDVPYSKYFQINQKDDSIVMNDFLREKPVFKKQDLVKDQNIFHVKFDIILCRNVIIYFNYHLQNHLFRFFVKNLFEGGHLILGKQETLRGHASTYFEKFAHAYIKRRDDYKYI